MWFGFAAGLGERERESVSPLCLSPPPERASRGLPAGDRAAAALSATPVRKVPPGATIVAKATPLPRTEDAEGEGALRRGSMARDGSSECGRTAHAQPTPRILAQGLAAHGFVKA